MSGTAYRTQIASELFDSSDTPLDHYFRVYDDLIAASDVDVLRLRQHGTSSLALIRHDGFLTGARILRDDPELTLTDASHQLGRELNGTHSEEQLGFAIIVAVRLMLMLDCAVHGRRSETWRNDQRYVDFVHSCFHVPKTTEITDRVARALASRKSLKAWKLKERSGIEFVKTNNVARHLHLDRDRSILYIFHQTTFLRLQLQQGQQNPNEEGSLENFSFYLQKGHLPPQLLAETLHSIQEVLFHLYDDKSRKILRRHIAKDGFDDDRTGNCMQPGYELSQNPEVSEYVYWGERLATLYEFTLNRPPRTNFERWIKWQSSESNAFAVALAALVISIMVGVLTLGLSGFQAWIAWKAWKEPVTNGPELSISMEELVEWIRQHER